MALQLLLQQIQHLASLQQVLLRSLLLLPSLARILVASYLDEELLAWHLDEEHLEVSLANHPLEPSLDHPKEEEHQDHPKEEEHQDHPKLLQEPLLLRALQQQLVQVLERNLRKDPSVPLLVLRSQQALLLLQVAPADLPLNLHTELTLIDLGSSMTEQQICR